MVLIDGQPAPVRDGIVPEEARPWAAIAVSSLLRGNVRNPLREMPDEQLRYVAASIGLYAIIVPHHLDQWGLAQLEGPGFWPGTVLPAIRAELDRRQRPKREWGADSPIARLKGLDIVEVVSKFTELTGTGDRRRGRCPLHLERTPSFYIYVDSQRWRCYASCASGGDVIDLLQRLGDQGKL